MFPLLHRNVPLVEQKIIAFLGQRELIKVKLVCKDWRRIVQEYIKYIKNFGAKIRLLDEAFLTPVTCYAPWCDWDMTVNKDGEVHIISDEKYIQLDINNLCLQSWRPIKSISVILAYFNGKSYPALRQVSEVLKSTQSKEQKKEQILNILNNNPHQGTNYKYFHRRCINSGIMKKMNKRSRDQDSKIYVGIGSGNKTCVAKLPMMIYKLDCLGTRMLCIGHNAEGKKTLIVYDIWNPDSVRKENVSVTELNHTEKLIKLQPGKSAEGSL